MGRLWSSVLEARAKGSACNFSLPVLPAFALPGIPLIKIPKLPRIALALPAWCPLDESEEEPLE